MFLSINQKGRGAGISWGRRRPTAGKERPYNILFSNEQGTCY